MILKKLLWIPGLLGLLSCQRQVPADALFEALPAGETGISFVNEIHDDKGLNIFNYRNFYNGGGVAIGDVNNDNLPDVFLTSNMGDNKLYLNRGSWKFEDVSEKAGIRGKHAWSTGVTFADVNGDGWMDIYVCNAGNRPNDDRANEFFISKGTSPGGIPTFADKASELGLADRGFSTHAAFFDYDRDGDLDLYLLNNSFIPVSSLGYRNLRHERDYEGGDKLFRNEGGIFKDVSEPEGIYGSVIGFGLGITIGDVNGDNWPDVYISNDFYERDYLYLNQHDGAGRHTGFRESLESAMNHTSLSSMGADIADVNNDGRLDLFVTDMLPGTDRRLKTTTTYEGPDLTGFKQQQGYHNQLMHNNLHLNLGVDGPTPIFSEIADFSGVAATDWSWGALLFDMDNDGRKDIFVANGIQRNLTDQDFITFFSDERTMQRVVSKTIDYTEILDKMASEPIPNYAFRNEGGLKFTNQAQAWGLGEPSLSNGAAYGDLDNDGDLDLVVNNVNEPVSVFQNHSERLKNHFLRVRLAGTPLNRQGIGASVQVFRRGGEPLLLQQMPNRGFQSSSDHVLVFGLGQNAAIDSVKITWPDDRAQVLRNPRADTELLLDATKADRRFSPPTPRPSTLQPFNSSPFLKYRHVENNEFVDYNRDPLLKQMYSREGPALAVGDVNGDGLDDVYLGGAVGQPKLLFTQKKDGSFAEQTLSSTELERAQEDVDALFFDADGDRDLDLFVVTGSNEFSPDAYQLQDRFYRNDGHGTFARATDLPNLTLSGSCVAAGDVDRDGDLDLFVGSRMIPGQYGLSPASALLINDGPRGHGKGVFKVQTKRYLPNAELGMITDARWADLDGDGFPELVTTQDWGPVTVYKNERGRALKPTAVPGSAGFWNRLHTADLDGDGDLDFIAGNLGLNNRLHPSPEHPAELAVNDFDRNGSTEAIISCVSENGKTYPMLLKGDLQKAIPGIRKKFLKYSDYAEKTLDELFDEKAREGTLKREVVQAATCVLLNDGTGGLRPIPLPMEAQLSPTYGIETLDYDHDGKTDVLLTGNFFDVLPEVGRYDASFGTVLRGLGGGKFAAVPAAQTGFFVRGQVRRMRLATASGGRRYLILAKNNDAVEVFSVSEKKGGNTD